MFGMTFNGKHSYKDFGLYVVEKHILSPSKIKITDTVPFMSGYYDFSTIGSNGQQNYSMRTITVKLALISKTKQGLYVLYSQILEWLEDVGQSKLIFDFMPDFYFLAELQGVPSFNEFANHGQLEVSFICNPLKYGINLEGNDIWDTFNFETDVSQIVEFDVVGTKTVSIYNTNRFVTPTINCTNAMSILLGGKNYNLLVGDNVIYGLKLLNGANTIIINGTGHINFEFHKEAL